MTSSMEDEKLNFEQLKKEVTQEVKNDYPSKIDVGNVINTPMLKILFDYFNVLNANKKMQKSHGLQVDGFVDNRNNMVNNLPEQATSALSYKVIVKYKDEFTFLVVLSRYYTDGKWISHVGLTSSKSTYISSDFLYKKVIYSAIAHSNLKGSYFIMNPNELSWNKKSLEKRDFSDVYLPEKIMQDLELFTGLFEKKGELMRYLLAGTPGTGKTEATIAIANILKNKGVTIMKTIVCDALKEKLELAELLAPTLLILDDLDLSLGSRSKGGFSRSLGTFLDAMDGTDKISKGVGIIATSNSIELLDQAAQRPGRFNKLMSFDEITRENVKLLILKSLKYNFGFPKTHPISKIFLDNKIVDFLHNSKQTGSWIFNNVEMVMRKIEILEIEDYDSDWVIEEFEQILTTVRTITNARYLQSGELKGKDNSKKIGLVPNDDDEEYDMEGEDTERGYIHEDLEVEKDYTGSSDPGFEGDEMPDAGA